MYFWSVTCLITLLKEYNFNFKHQQYHLTNLFSKVSNLSPDQIFKLSYDSYSTIHSINFMEYAQVFFISKRIVAVLSSQTIELAAVFAVNLHNFNYTHDCYGCFLDFSRINSYLRNRCKSSFDFHFISLVLLTYCVYYFVSFEEIR